MFTDAGAHFTPYTQQAIVRVQTVETDEHSDY